MPGPLALGCRPSQCPCGEPSLLHQRGKGWDVSRHRFTLKYLRMVFTLREFTWRAILARLIALHDFTMILTDWASLVYTIIMLVVLPNRVLIIYGFIAAWAIQLWVYSLFNVAVLLPRGLDITAETLALFALLYKFPSLILLRFFALAYNCFYYLPFVRNKTPVKRRLRQGDPKPVYSVAGMARTWGVNLNPHSASLSSGASTDSSSSSASSHSSDGRRPTRRPLVSALAADASTAHLAPSHPAPPPPPM